MEKLNKKYDNTVKALRTLEEIITDYKINQKQINILAPTEFERQKFLKYMRDSLIQRFEYTFDCFWKYINFYLDQETGIKIDVPTPKRIFRELFRLNLISENQINLALQMVDHRNLTSHTYHEPLAKEISEKIPDYFEFIKDILNKINC
ncbi:nucleotidyltransferase substrate binding protein [Candidatus Babeliales bacterium]|nr:nucleotidyltransferase substrate binding protein [Candidatus Babeliales bacterium]MCF7899834.1 nucleotidyltransferase substrate binding protein [Candidatus Babeliales bacterium]